MKNILALAFLALTLTACGNDNDNNNNNGPYGYSNANVCQGPQGFNGFSQGCSTSQSVDQFGNCTQQFLNDYTALQSNLVGLRRALNSWGGTWFQAAQAAKQSCDGFFSVHGLVSCNANGNGGGYNQQPGFSQQPGYNNGHRGGNRYNGNLSGRHLVNDCRQVDGFIGNPNTRPRF